MKPCTLQPAILFTHSSKLLTTSSLTHLPCSCAQPPTLPTHLVIVQKPLWLGWPWGVLDPFEGTLRVSSSWDVGGTPGVPGLWSPEVWTGPGPQSWGHKAGFSGSRCNRLYLGCRLEAAGSLLQRLAIRLTFPSTCCHGNRNISSAPYSATHWAPFLQAWRRLDLGASHDILKVLLEPRPVVLVPVPGLACLTLPGSSCCCDCHLFEF